LLIDHLTHHPVHFSLFCRFQLWRRVNHTCDAICKKNVFQWVMIPFPWHVIKQKKILINIFNFWNIISESHVHWGYAENKSESKSKLEIAVAITSFNNSLVFVLSLTHFIVMSLFLFRHLRKVLKTNVFSDSEGKRKCTFIIYY
jgi:hypothetical protein